MITSVEQLDLSIPEGRPYEASPVRHWREEFIYFVLVDRFHDDLSRQPACPATGGGFGQPDRLSKFCGGTLAGITHQLPYIQGLGCTAIWLSPVFENNITAYHGYAIQNFLEVDPHFGTKADLATLVEMAHRRGMKVFLDVVIHHSGDNWSYKGHRRPPYKEGVDYCFGSWHQTHRPLPIELRDERIYWKKGRIVNYDNYPETTQGDFFGLKTFRNDKSPEALRVLDILCRVHCYWIKEVNVDGFRLDTVKHLPPWYVSQFCQHIQEYAGKMGKENFFLFGEVVGDDQLCNRYLTPTENTGTVSKGLDTALDFPLHFVLADVIKGIEGPHKLIERYDSLRHYAFPIGRQREYLVTFLDNHDQVAQLEKCRFGYGATREQLIAGAGFLLCAIGVPCLYYGTEQGFAGHGNGDECIREAMFDPDDTATNTMNTNSYIYQQIAAIAALRKSRPALIHGSMHFCLVSNDGLTFHLPTSNHRLVAFSRRWHNEEIVVAINTSLSSTTETYIAVDKECSSRGGAFYYLYGNAGSPFPTQAAGDAHLAIRISLPPGSFVILGNQPEADSS